MENRKFRSFYILSIVFTLLASAYPLYMGIRVIYDMLKDGTVLKENYPKYIIPYTPIAFAVILGVLLMPILLRAMKKYALLGGTAVSVAAFFGLEILLERKVVVTAVEAVESVASLADWQMYLCAYLPSEVYLERAAEVTTTKTPVDILIGNYNPAYKLHFYMISVVIILGVLNCIYGFAQMIKTGDGSRKKALIMQSVSVAVFLGLSILACFTAFWRDGRITVSPLSAVLMSVFFILLGVTVGIFVGSLLLGRKRRVLLAVPAAVSAAVTLLMYVGEMILLHGHLYRFGDVFFFKGIPGMVLAPVDILVIALSGLVTLVLMRVAAGKKSVGA